MNPIAKALDNIKYTIPIAILKEAFTDSHSRWRNPNLSIDDCIATKVIRPRVLLDCNLVGGTTVNISLDGIAPEIVDQFTTIYSIPPDRTAGKTILSVLSLGYMPYQANFNMMSGNLAYATPTSMNSVTQAAQRIGDSYSAMPVLANAQTELVGHNVIMVREQHKISSTYYIRCILANSDNMGNISPRSILAFAKLCELAVKSYIYNQLIIRIDQSFLQGGQELGAFKNIVESYADAEEMYNTHLREVWQATAFMNDSISYDRFLRLQVSPGI